MFPLSALARFERAKRALSSLAGWRRWAAGLALGLLAAASMPPLYALPALALSFTGFIWLLDGRPGDSWWGAFVDGWWFGLGFFGAGLYWIALALLVDAERFGWLVPLVVPALAGGFALFSALAALAAHRIVRKGLGRVVFFALAWAALEWLRGHILTGFPWNLLGSAWAFSTVMVQTAALFGAYGLSLLTLLSCVAPAALGDGDLSPGTRWRFAGLLTIGLPLAMALFGGLRLPDRAVAPVADVRLRLVQPAIAQAQKWDEAQRVANLNRHVEMSFSAGAERITHVIWSETAVPFVVDRDNGARARVALAAPPGGAVIFGALRTSDPAADPFRVWNGVEAIDDRGRVVAAYDKFHLVPFGEYMPLRGLLGFDKLTAGDGDFSAGPGPRTLSVPGLPPFGPLVCYEAIFPGDVVDRAHRPRWLLNVTNDAWFGESAGPYQHFASARLRTVEEGLPLVRVANTGISAVVDPYGRVTAMLGLGRSGVLDADLPEALAAPPPYARWGDGLFLTLALAVAVGGLSLCPRTRKPVNSGAR